MIRPTKRTVLWFAASLPLALVIAAAAPSAWPVSVFTAGLVLFAFAADLRLALRPQVLRVGLDLPERLYIGETGALTLRFPGQKLDRAVSIEVLLDREGDLDPLGIVAIILEPGQGLVVDLPLVPRRRGRVMIERLWLRWSGPFGLVQIIHRIEIGRGIDVVQNVRGVQSAALQFFAREAVFGVRVQQERGEGTEFDALKEYVPGLDTRYIDWKHSARHHKLVCKEFRVERNHPIVMAFDTGHLMLEPIDGIPRLDHAINAGLLLAWIALRGGDLVGSYAFDAAPRHWVQPLRGLPNYPKLLRSTAELAYRTTETNFTLGLAELAVRLKRRALVVLFTDFVDTVTAELLVESLQRVGQKHVVIFVSLRDPYLQASVDAEPDRFETVARAVIADDFRRDRRLVFDRLDRLGIHCLDVAREELSVGLIIRYLMIKQRGLL